MKEVTEEKEKCSKRLENTDQMNTRNAYPLPKVPATKTAAFDTYMKLEVGQNVKAADTELELIQSAVMDSMAPLTTILEVDAKCDKVTHKEDVDAAKAAIELVCNAKFEIISQMNKALSSP